MQHLKVSGAVRPLKWSLGVKWLIELLKKRKNVKYVFEFFIKMCIVKAITSVLSFVVSPASYSSAHKLRTICSMLIWICAGTTSQYCVSW